MCLVGCGQSYGGPNACTRTHFTFGKSERLADCELRLQCGHCDLKSVVLFSLKQVFLGNLELSTSNKQASCETTKTKRNQIFKMNFGKEVKTMSDSLWQNSLKDTYRQSTLNSRRPGAAKIFWQKAKMRGGWAKNLFYQ